MKKRERFLALVQGVIDDGDYTATVVIHIPVPKIGWSSRHWHDHWRAELAEKMHHEGYEEIAYSWYRHGLGADIAFGSNDDDDIANVIPDDVREVMEGMYPAKPDPDVVAAGFRAVFGLVSLIPGVGSAIGSAGNAVVDLVEGVAKSVED